MGLKYQVGDHKITQYGTTSKAEIKLDDAVGLSQEKDGTWSMVGDFYHSHNPKLKKYYGNAERFNKDLSTQYGVAEAFIRLEDQGYICTENEEGNVGDDGLITLSFQNWS